MRAYMISDGEQEGCVVFVADTAKEARNMAVGHDMIMDCDFIDIRVRWCRDVDVSGLDKGEIPVLEGLYRGAYLYVFGLPCPHCGADEPDLKIYKEYCDRCEPGADIDEHSVSVSEERDRRGGVE